MKSITLLLGMVIGLTSLVNAQRLPSIDEVFNNAKANPKVYERLKSTYKIEAPKEAKFEKIARIGSGQWDPSKFNPYRSSQGKSLNFFWPEDRAYIVFKVTTPESAEGVTYELPLVVEYTRIQNQKLTNSWHFHRWYFDNPYSARGGKLDALFLSLIEQDLGEIEFSFKPTIMTDFPPCLEYMVNVTDISYQEDSEKRQFASNRQEIQRIYEFTGTKIYFDDYDETKVSHLYEDQLIDVKVTFVREVVDGKEKDWEVNSYYCIGFTEEGNRVETDDIYLIMKRIGFTSMYKNEPQKTVIPYYSEAYSDNWEEGIKEALIKLYNKDQSGEDEIRKYTAGDSIASGIINYMHTFKDRMVEVDTKWIQVELKNNSDMTEEEPESVAKIDISYSRETTSRDKSLVKKYKSAGMSKDVLKSTGGFINSTSDKNFLRVALIDGEIKIIEIPKLEEEIPF